MELIKFLLHFARSFGFFPSNGDDIQQGTIQILPGPESMPELSARFRCPNFSPSGEREPLVFCNTPNNRSCWFKPNEKYAKDGFDINTDYENSWPDGSNREFWLTVTNQAIWPDGYNKTKGKVVNGTYPGPLIEACWGDNITIHVTNYMVDNGTTIHWHGLRQWNTSESDGVNGITQCPIAPGHTYTYNFRATQYGHSWYHSHYSLQYPDGVLGPLIIHGPMSANYDVDVGTVLVSDWSHETAFIDFFQELDGGVPEMQSNLLNGTGWYPCNPEDPRCLLGFPKYFTLKFEYGKKYLLRLINTSTESQFKFEIDNHNLTVVSADFVPIHPYTTKYLNIGIGQRYSVIVTAIPTQEPSGARDDNYWIRTIPASGCGSIQHPIKRSGIVRYTDSKTLPVSKFWGSDIWESEPNKCVDENMKDLVPVVAKRVPRRHANNITDDTYEVGLDQATEDHPMPHGNYSRWDIAAVPMWLDWGNPTILNVGRNISHMSQELAIIPQDYVDQWVILVIVGNLTNPGPENVGKFAIATQHPIHLHGHDFHILAQNDTEWDTPDWPAWKAFAQMNYKTPPRRDVALLPSGGYLVIAFKTDNPGTWLLHCHIAWHASSGLALQIMENQKAIEGTIRDKTAIEETCLAWDKWNSTNHAEQDDSGV